MVAPWERYAPPAAAPAVRPLTAPRPDPYKVEDQQMQRDAADRAERAADRADKTAQRQAAAAERTAEAVTKPTEFQSKSAGFLGRMLQAEANYGVVPEAERGGRSVARQAFHNIAPGIENTFVNSDGRQKADQAVENFIAASLRQESGANIVPSEFDRQYKIFFPASGDSPAVLAQKAEARRQAIEGFKIAAGPLADAAGQTVQVSNAGQPLSEEESLQQLKQRVAASKTPADAAAIIQWLIANGRPPNEETIAAILSNVGNTNPDVRPTNYPGGGQQPVAPPSPPEGGLSIPAQLGEATGNAIGAIGQGLAALPDIATNAAGAILALPADALGFTNVANQLRNPITIGGLIEKALPTPQTGVGRGVRLAGQLGGGLVSLPGGATNALVSRIAGDVPAGFVSPAASKIAAEGRNVIAAGERQGVPIRQADARPGVRGDFAAVAQSPTGGPRIGNALASDREAVAQRVSNIADGQARDPYALGNQVQGAMNRQGTRTASEGKALYARVDKAAPGHAADPAPVIGAIDQKIAELVSDGATANAAEIKVLDGIKADFGESGISVKSLQTQRRALRQRLKDNGIDFGSADASYMSILGEAGKALESSLANNPRALGALKSANAKWAERSAFRQEVAKQFLGSKGAPLKPEAAASRFVSMTKKGGDYNRFSRGFQELETTERADFAATIAEGMGKTKSGEFSYGQFVKDFEGMNPRAVRDLYGAKGQEALNDLRTIAKAKSETAGAMNHSNTGGVVARNNGFRNLVLTAFGAGVAGLPGAVVGAVSRGALEKFSSGRQARMLLDPTFTKWLKSTPNTTNPAAIDRHFARLTSLAANSPALAADAKALQTFLADALQQSPGRLAASQDEDDRR